MYISETGKKQEEWQQMWTDDIGRVLSVWERIVGTGLKGGYFSVNKEGTAA